MELSGERFNEKYPLKFYKVTNKKEKHHELRYETGLNIDPIKFNPNGSCEAGGIYFADEENVYKFLEFGPNIRKVTIPDDARVYIEDGKYKADRVILSPKISGTELEKFYLMIVKQDGYSLKYVPEEMKTEEMCLEAVKQDGYMIQFVPEEMITDDLCLIAVKQYGYMIQFVPEEMKTEDLCLIAAKRNGHALKYIPDKMKTYELCLIAVKQDGYTLEFIPDKIKTEEMCLIAVKQNGYALEYVPEEIKEKIEEAVN